MFYPALTLNLKCLTLHLKWSGWSKMQPDLINMFWRPQGHSKEVVRVLEEGGTNRVGDQ